jgi:hypothetical protein
LLGTYLSESLSPYRPHSRSSTRHQPCDQNDADKAEEEPREYRVVDIATALMSEECSDARAYECADKDDYVHPDTPRHQPEV